MQEMIDVLKLTVSIHNDIHPMAQHMQLTTHIVGVYVDILYRIVLAGLPAISMFTQVINSPVSLHLYRRLA